MANNNGGPWGGGNRGGGDEGGRRPTGHRPGQGGRPSPAIDDLMRKGQDRLRVLMGGKGGRPGGPAGGSGGPGFGRGTFVLVGLVLLGMWLMASVYTVRPEEQSVELFLGEYSSTGQPGLNFAPWPVVTYEVLPVTREQTESLGTGRETAVDNGLMLTTDANIVDIEFEIVWNIRDPAKFLFNLAEPQQTIRSVSESAMREVVARSQLSPILNRDRDVVAAETTELIQETLDSYDAGVNILRLNLDKADPPAEVIDAFRDVQAAEQERDRLEREADAYANRVLAGARGEAAEILEDAEAYRARVVNEAQGSASRFSAVLAEYRNAPEVTRKRLYLETMEDVLGRVEKVILDEQGAAAGQGVVPYLPINELRRGSGSATQPAAGQAAANGGTN